MRDTDRLYNTAQWRRTRKAVLARDNHLCQLQRTGCTIRATAVDHIIPLKDLGSNSPMLLDPHNLRATCTSCNSARNSNTPSAPPSRVW